MQEVAAEGDGGRDQESGGDGVALEVQRPVRHAPEEAEGAGEVSQAAAPGHIRRLPVPDQIQRPQVLELAAPALPEEAVLYNE